MTTINDGDKIIISASYWVSYPDVVLLASDILVAVSSDIQSRFKIRPEDIDAVVRENSK